MSIHSQFFPARLTPGFLLAFLLSGSALLADDLYTKPADPVNLVVTVDRDHAVSALIPASGGVIVMTSADGTVYTLTFPQDALALDTIITLVPVATVDGLAPSASGALWGLQMEPDGLRLYQPATLVIDPPAGLTFSAAAHAPAGYHAGGANFHMEPLQLTETKLTAKVIHFSGLVDLTFLGGDGIPRLVLHTPEEFEDRANQVIAEIIQQERQSQEDGNDPDPNYLVKVLDVLQQYYEAVIGPEMKAAETDCGLAQRVGAKGIAFARQAETYSRAEDTDSLIMTEAASVRVSVVNAEVNCWADEKKRCRWEGDDARTIEILTLARQLQIQGQQASLDEIPICAGWWGTTHGTIQIGDSNTNTVSTTVYFTRDPNPFAENYVLSTGQMTWTLTGGICPVTAGGGPLTFDMSLGDGVMTIQNGGTYSAVGASYAVPQPNVTFNCPPPNGPVTLPYPLAGGAWIFTPPGAQLPIQNNGRLISGSYTGAGVDLTWTLTKSGK